MDVSVALARVIVGALGAIKSCSISTVELLIGSPVITQAVPSEISVKL